MYQMVLLNVLLMEDTTALIMFLKLNPHQLTIKTNNYLLSGHLLIHSHKHLPCNPDT
jgi:hypothetical protein